MTKKRFFEKILWRIFHIKIKKITKGYLSVYYLSDESHFGNKDSLIKANIKINKTKFFYLVFLKGHLGFAQAYGENLFSTTNLTSLLTLSAINFKEEEKGISWILNKINNLYYSFFEKNNIKGSKKNISSHYDLGNKLFKTFLDKKMQYSCALYNGQEISLSKAQHNKMETICKTLNLSPNQHLLEIGSGWGGLSIFIAKKIGCKITTVTISKEQYSYAKRQIEKENLTHLINIKLKDYREIKGKYDKIVSIEMIEAVGHQYYQEYFSHCESLLKPGGLFLIQAILIADHRYTKYKNYVDFIKLYIFPGGNLPSLNKLNQCANIANMRLEKYMDITKNYTKTLDKWQQTFNENKSYLTSIGYDKYFQKIWNFYFSYCQAGFITEHIRNAHILLKRIE